MKLLELFEAKTPQEQWEAKMIKKYGQDRWYDIQDSIRDYYESNAILEDTIANILAIRNEHPSFTDFSGITKLYRYVRKDTPPTDEKFVPFAYDKRGAKNFVQSMMRGNMGFKKGDFVLVEKDFRPQDAIINFTNMIEWVYALEGDDGEWYRREYEVWMKRTPYYIGENFADGKEITEKIKWQSSLSQKVFEPDQLEYEADPTYGLSIPLSNSIVNKIMPKQRARVFHVTRVENISNMLSLQGQKKSISAFLNMNPYFFSPGIFGGGGGGMVFELDANVLGAFNRDVQSSVDDSGRRWITLYALIESSGKNRNDLQPMYDDMGKLIQRLLDKHAPDMDYTDEYDDYVLTTNKWRELGKKLTTDGDSKKLSVVIKDYIDGVYAIMIKYAKPVRQALQSALIDPDPDPDWDEIIVNDIKILQAHVLKDSTENTEKLKELQSKGIKVRVWNSSQELSNYTKKVGAQQKLGENFADGKRKGRSRPGRVKRAGASCKGSVTSLRAKAKKSSGERAKMYHWCANMKSGRKKK